jgi:hypothetical protein
MRFFSRAALVASLAASSLALPALRTYRGKSPYISVHEDPALDAPLSFPNPRDDPAFYQARYAAAEALERGKWHERPAWADRVVDNISAASARLDGYAAAVGVDLPYLRRTLLPAASGRPAWNPHTRRSFAVPTQGEELVLRNNASASSFRQADSGFDYRRDKVRGVNLGNWLVLEAWMDAALFGELNSQVVNAPYGAIIDEWTMGLYGNYRAVEKIIKRHLDEWMTEDEFRQIAAAGLNHVSSMTGCVCCTLADSLHRCAFRSATGRSPRPSARAASTTPSTSSPSLKRRAAGPRSTASRCGSVSGVGVRGVVVVR